MDQYSSPNRAHRALLGISALKDFACYVIVEFELR